MNDPAPLVSTPARLAPPGGAGFACAVLGVAAAAALLAGWAPLPFSVVTVFLFAGPHNWLEFRYFLARMPARWGRLRGFFLLALAGLSALSVGFLALPWLVDRGRLDDDLGQGLYSLLLSLLVLWVVLLAHLRS